MASVKLLEIRKKGSPFMQPLDFVGGGDRI